MKRSKKQRNIEEEQQRVIKAIGARIKALRLQQGHSSYADFAYENDIGRSQFGKYEQGTNIEISSLVKVLIALDISVKDFFSDEAFE